MWYNYTELNNLVVYLNCMFLTFVYRYGCRQMPTPANLQSCILQVARFEFVSKPAAAISLMNSGIPEARLKFWSSTSAEGVLSIYKTLTVSSTKILDSFDPPDCMYPAENRVYEYLQDMIGNMPSDSLQKFLRFTTGSSILVVKQIHIQFNRLEGLQRRPISHTCDCMLELPVSYSNYSDFHAEWATILANSDDYNWVMDSI